MNPPRSALFALGAAFLVASGLSLPGCLSGPPPVFDGPRPLGTNTFLFQPAVRVGSDRGQPEPRILQALLAQEARQNLAQAGVGVVEDGPGDERMSRLRDLVLEALVRERSQGRGGRLRGGTDLGLGDQLDGLADRGTSTAILMVLTRWGTGPDEKGYMPVPDELITPKELRPEYVIPTVPRETRGALVLDLLVMDGVTGKVVTHRRVADPGEDPGQILAVLPVLVREATRGLSVGASPRRGEGGTR